MEENRYTFNQPWHGKCSKNETKSRSYEEKGNIGRRNEKTIHHGEKDNLGKNIYYTPDKELISSIYQEL